MSTYDLSSPFMHARIITKDKDELPLWIGGEEQSKVMEKLGIDPKVTTALSYVQDITIETQLNQVNKITVVLTPPLDAARALLDSDFMTWGGDSFIEVQFGYTGGAPSGAVLSEVYTAMILKPDIQLGTDATLTINAQGVGYKSSVQKGDTTATGTREALLVAVLKREKILTEGRSALKAIYTDSAAVEAAGGDAESQRNYAVQVVIDAASRADPLAGIALAEIVTEGQGNLTDLQFAQKIANEAHCDLSILGGVVKVKSRNVAKEEKPKYVLRFYDYPGGVLVPGFGTFPILSVSSSTVFQFLAAGTRGIAFTGVESEERKSNKGAKQTTEPTSGDSTTGSKSEDAKVAPPVDSKAYPPGSPEGRGLEALIADPAFKATAENQAKAQYSATKENNGVRMEIETFAMPKVAPNDNVAVIGVAKKFDGNYRVLKVTHTLGSAGSSTSLEVIGGLAAFGPEGISGLKVNEEEPDEDEAEAAGEKVKAEAGSGT